MKKIDIVRQIIETLIENGALSFKVLRDYIHIRPAELDYILRELEFLNLISQRKDKIYLSSHAYSLLFDAVIASAGTTSYVQGCFDDDVVKERQTIPGLLVPILLLRAANPYIGMILRDLDQRNEIGIDREKLDFLLEYFWNRKLDYTSVRSWREIEFGRDEFYDLWIILNKELSMRLKTSIDHPRFSKEPKGQADTVQDWKPMHIRRTDDAIPVAIKRIREIKISLRNLIRFIEEQENETRGLVITSYADHALKWEFVGEKVKFPTMFLLEDGIYIDERTAQEFSTVQIDSQASYLERRVLISQDLYGSKGESSRGDFLDERR